MPGRSVARSSAWAHPCGLWVSKLSSRNSVRGGAGRSRLAQVRGKDRHNRHNRHQPVKTVVWAVTVRVTVTVQVTVRVTVTVQVTVRVTVTVQVTVRPSPTLPTLTHKTWE